MRRPRLLRSIRTRLSAWYAVFLVLIILVLGILVSTVLERQLREAVDNRLLESGSGVTSQFGVGFRFGGPVVIVPPSDEIAIPSHLVQVVDNRGRTWFRSENLGEERSLPFALETVQDGQLRYETVELNGVTLRTLNYPIELRKRHIGSVIVAEPLNQLTQTVNDLRRLFILAALVGAALAGAGGWVLAGRTLRPVDQMAATARRIVSGSGDTLPLETRLEFPRTGDEIARLGTTFNDLLDRLEAALEQQRRFVADASHELRTPLTAVQGNIDLLEKQLVRARSDSNSTDETISELRRESKRMGRLVSDLLTLARLESATGLSLQVKPQPLAPIAGDAIRTASALHPDALFRIDSIDTVHAAVDAYRLEQVLVIVLDNAARHSGAGSPVELRIRDRGSAAGLMIEDWGAGIPPEDLPHVFNRFFRADASRERVRGGTGLGLAIAQAVVKAHGGTIGIESELGRGTTVSISVPKGALMAPES
ncbi:HAMP domain-containing sensor histidine kinase [soil metagenome]